MHCVIMFEFNHKGETLSPTGQVNEVFGPFASDEEANVWVLRAEKLINNRHWLIIPMSEPSGLNSLDPQMN